MKMDIIKKAIISIGTVLIGIILGYLLLALVYCIDIPEERFEKTMQILSEEGYHPRELLRTGKSDYYAENYPDILDIGTDEFIYKFSLRNTEESCFSRALVNDYGRYWHGYVVFLRPLFRIFDLDEVRYINLGIQLLLFCVLALTTYAVSRRTIYVWAELAVYLIMGPNSMACNMQYSSIYYVAVIFAIIAMRFWKVIDKDGRYIYLFLISGMATSFMDFLTYPLLSWCFPATFVIMLYSSKNIFKHNIWLNKIIQLAISAIMWIIGYITMWAGKWTIGIALSDIDVWDYATSEVGFIIGSNEKNLFIRLQSFFKNWNHLTYKPFVLVFLIAFIIWVIAMVRKGIVKDYRIPAFTVILFAAPVWYIVGYSHTWGHHIFTWRIALTTVIAAVMIACLSTDHSEGKEVILIKCEILRALACITCVALGVATYWIIPAEKQNCWNYNLTHDEYIIPQGQDNGYVMDFIPMYSHVCSVDPIITSQDYAGYIELVLLDGDRVIDIQKITFDGSEDSNVKVLPVDWHLKRGKRYQIAISTKNSKESAKIWITDDT